MHIELRGREYVIDELLPGGEIRLLDVALKEPELVSKNSLLDALFDGQMEFLGDGRENSLIQRRLVESFIDDIVMLKDDDPRKKEFKRRYAYVRAILDAELTEFNAATLEPLIERTHGEIKDPKDCPNWKTVYYGWFVPYILAGEDVRACVPNYKKKGNRKHKFAGARKRKGQKFTKAERLKADEVAEVVEEVINEEFMNEQRLSVAEVYRKLEQRIEEINEFRKGCDRLPLPNRDSIYDIIVKMDEYEKDKARHGKRWADREHGQRKRGPRPTRPLQRVEIDHTKLDLFVVDPETRLPLGRPTITVAIDKYSRMIVGVHVGFDPAGYLSVMLCLLNAIRRKGYVKMDYPDVENEWDTYGIPEVLVVDNGSEFHSQDLENACLQIGTVITYCPVKHPWFKGSCERYFGRVNRELLHNQPGTTFSNFIDREDYDPKKNAVIGFDAFMEMLHIWLIDDYSREIHGGLEDIPADVWKEGVDKYPPRLPRRGQDLKIVLGKIERRTVGNRGIRLFNLVYNDERLAALRLELKGKKADLKFNPDDLSVIHVYNPKDDSYMSIKAEDQEYTKGLSQWQHAVIRRYRRKEVKRRRSPYSLNSARRKIQAIVNREWGKRLKGGARSKMARWRRVRQRNYSASLEMNSERRVPAADQGEVRGTLVMLNRPSAPEKVVSDIGNALAIRGNVEGHNGNGAGHPPGVAEPAPVSKDVSSGKRRKRAAAGVAGVERVDAAGGPDERSTDAVELFDDGEELDMSGFRGSYRLPAHGGVDE